MTAPPDLGPSLCQQREQRSWTRNELARRLISLPEGTDTQIKLTSTETPPQPGTGT